MRTLTSIILLLVMLAFAAGLPQAMHEQEHERADAQTAAILHQPRSALGSLGDGWLTHARDQCVLCVMMQSPTSAARERAWLVDTGLWVRFVSMLAVSQSSQTFPARISCRGPPA